MSTSSEGAGPGPSVFIADDAPDTFEFLKAVVAGAGGWSAAGDARTLESFMIQAETVAADIWLVSSGFLGLMSKHDLRRVLSANPEGVVIAVTDSPDYAEIKTALRCGARDVIVGGASAEDVRDIIEMYYEEAARRRELANLQNVLTPEPESKLVFITGGDGGTGKSFIAAQLAGLIARHAKAKTCLVDLDFEFGSLTATLGMAGAGGSLVDLIHVAEELEAGQVESVIIQHPAGFGLVPGVADHATEGRRKVEEVPVGKILSILRTLFDVVICDIPASLLGGEILREADSIYIVATPDKTGARCARLLGKRIDDARLIVNMADRRGALSVTKMAETSGLPVEAVLPEDTGAGRLFDQEGEILAGRTKLALIRSLIPVAQRSRPFDELAEEKRLAWLTGPR